MYMKEKNFEYLLGGLLILILSIAIAQEEGIRGESRQLFIVPAFCIMLLMGAWGSVSNNLFNGIVMYGRS